VFLLQLALYVLSYLEPRDLARASQTCHYWHILAEDNLLWREKCREEGLTDTAVWGGRITRRRPQNRSGYTPSNASMKTAWKNVYKRQKLIENNWSRFPLQPPKVCLPVSSIPPHCRIGPFLGWMYTAAERYVVLLGSVLLVVYVVSLLLY